MGHHVICRWTGALALAAVVVAGSLAAFPQTPAPGNGISLDEYVTTLDQLIERYSVDQPDSVCCTEHPEDVPPVWVVNAAGNQFRVSTDFLGRYGAKPRDVYTVTPDDDQKVEKTSARKRILTQLHALRDGAASFRDLQTSQAELLNAKARSSAQQILARGEFRKVRTPGSQEDWADRIRDWIERQLAKLLGHAPDTKFASKALIWTLIAIAVALAGLWLRTLLARSEQRIRFDVLGPELPVSSKSWRIWLEESRKAAAQQLWREAVHCGYWAAISALEAGGAWKPDKARTPREYPRLMRPESERYGVLVGLTRRFERVWYAQWPATVEDYQETVDDLQKIGCA
ncbi:MAG: DUF4129 domain-containing protein [Terriglobales bacterium]|jgi:hypothetical protein